MKVRGIVNKLVIAGMCAGLGVGVSAVTAESAAAVEKSQCVVYVDGPFNLDSGMGVTTHGSGVCSNAKNVTGKFLYRWHSIDGWHTKTWNYSFGTVADSFDLRWHSLSTAAVNQVYAEATVCYKSGTSTKCRSDSELVNLN